MLGRQRMILAVVVCCLLVWFPACAAGKETSAALPPTGCSPSPAASPVVPSAPALAAGPAAYVAWSADLVARVDDASATVEDVVSSDEYDPTMDPRKETAKAVEVWTQAYCAARAYHPPTDFQSRHAQLVGGLRDYDVAAAMIVDGVNRNDHKLVDSGMIQEEQGRAAVHQALAEIRQP
ncbi:MAG TPA: hypothetical protein VFZ25_19630 [Chloroflexota bacterium]|nr:hypothetical protein [Chloroflexota bacterium]